LVDAKVGGTLAVMGSTFHESVDFSSTTVEGELLIGTPQHGRTRWERTAQLVSRNTVVGAVQDWIDELPEWPAPTGWLFVEFRGPASSVCALVEIGPAPQIRA
jgi:hypothetical protein